MEPLLSIGVPTFNRAHLLQHLLRSLAREYARLAVPEQVEVIISDNCSEDDTKAVVASFQSELPIRYHRNDRNIGPAANVVQIPTLASGKYCWIFGDDDLLVPGALAQVLQLLQAYPNVPAIVVGYSYQQEANRDRYIRDNAPLIFENPAFVSSGSPQLVACWEQTILKTLSPAAHTSVVGCVFNTSQWRQHAPKPEVVEQAKPFSSLESTFPHTLTWASFLIGREVLFAPKPHVYFFVGAQQWLKPLWATLLFTLCLELAQYMRGCSASEESIIYFEDQILKSNSLQQLLCEPSDYARRFFSFEQLIAKYGHRYTLWQNLNKIAQRASRDCQLRLMIHILRASWRSPKCWAPCTRALLALLRRILAQFIHQSMPFLKS